MKVSPEMTLTVAPFEALRRCKDCGIEKPTTHFYRYKRGGLYSRCKACHYTRTQEWRDANREKVRELDRSRYRARYSDKIRARKILRKYGLSAPEYAALMEAQGGVCAICLKPFAEPDGKSKGAQWDIASVDHDHETGRVRGILHRRCNLALELLLNDEETARAREYLRQTT